MGEYQSYSINLECLILILGDFFNLGLLFWGGWVVVFYFFWGGGVYFIVCLSVVSFVVVFNIFSIFLNLFIYWGRGGYAHVCVKKKCRRLLNFIDLNILPNFYLILFHRVLKICKYYFKGAIKKEDEGIRHVKCLH